MDDEDGIEDSSEFETEIGSAYFTQARCVDCPRIVLVSVHYKGWTRCETCWRAYVARLDRQNPVDHPYTVEIHPDSGTRRVATPNLDRKS